MESFQVDFERIDGCLFVDLTSQGEGEVFINAKGLNGGGIIEASWDLFKSCSFFPSPSSSRLFQRSLLASTLIESNHYQVKREAGR